MRFQVFAVVCLLALAGCGGGDGGSPPPAAPVPPPVIGTTGGTITETSGAAVIFPAGAVASDTTFRIAMDSTGAPPVPAELDGTGNIYVITPHGGEFAEAVEVRIPAPSVTLQPNEILKIAKAEPGGKWIVLDATETVDGKLSVRVHDFSFFRAVVLRYRDPLASREPLSFTTSLVCVENPTCTDQVGPFNATFTVVGNNGVVPENCPNLEPFIGRGDGQGGGEVVNSLLGDGRFVAIARTGGSSTNTIVQRSSRFHTWGVGYTCGTFQYLYGSTLRESSWKSLPQFPQVAVMAMPPQVDVVEGLSASLDAIIGGGAIEQVWGSNPTRQPQASDHATVDWERSDNDGASWRVVARSFQHEGNWLPYGVGSHWKPWSVRHSFIATIADHRALIRARACYTPPPPTAGAATPCNVGPATRVNVLQQSALPAIVDQPRSVLIRTAETANFSATVSGLPAPTLRWQTRPANSSGGWTDVQVGTGATTASYTTAPRVPSDNGEQYRVVATNALGNIASTPVTVSVSDLDVAPSITTQPASLSLTSGNDAVFAVVAYGTEALSYQWRFNGANIAGANSPVLRLAGVTGANAGSYSVTVSNSAGDEDSNNAVLSVTQGAPAAVAPSIVTQPSPVTVNSGNTATLAVGVAGTGPFTFQWRRNGADMSGATSAVLTFNSVALPNAGDYSVRVTNSAGQVVSDTVFLDVTAAGGAEVPTITSQPATLIVPLNGSGVIAVGTTGSGPLSYQWYLNGELLPGSTLPVLNFSNLGEVDFGTYTVTVTNSVASVTSEPAELILLGAPVISQQPVAATAIEGNNALFFVQAEGSGLRYQWSVNGTPIPGAIGSAFNTPPLVAANSGAVYSVLVYNGAGHLFSQGAVLTVQTIVAPSVIQQPVDVTVVTGQSATLCAAFSGTFPMTLRMQQWNGSAWVSVLNTQISSTDSECYITSNLTLADSGAQYQLVAGNAAGLIVTNTATITVTAPPLVTTTLVSVALTGGPPEFLSYQPSISADGRLVAFTSQGTNLIPGGTDNGSESGHAYLRDLSTGTTTLINRTPTGGVSSRGVLNLELSSNGRYAVFTSLATDLVADDTNNSVDVFRRDLLTGTTVRLSVLPDGTQIEDAGNASYDAQLNISGDGRWVTFLSANEMTTDGSPNNGYFLYVRDAQTGFTRYVAGTPTLQIAYVALSDNGEYIAYAPGIVAPNPQTINLYDVEADDYYEIFSSEQSPSPAGLRQGISISANGRYVAFSLNSAALTGSTSNQVMVVDRNNPGVATLVSTGANGAGDGASAWPQISGDGRYVTFSTEAPNLTAGQGMLYRPYLMMRDLVSGTTEVAAHRANGSDVPFNTSHAISLDGSTIAFVADHAEVFGSLMGAQVFAEPRP